MKRQKKRIGTQLVLAIIAIVVSSLVHASHPQQDPAQGFLETIKERPDPAVTQTIKEEPDPALTQTINEEPDPALMQREPSPAAKNLVKLHSWPSPPPTSDPLGVFAITSAYMFENVAQVIGPGINQDCPGGQVVVHSGSYNRLHYRRLYDASGWYDGNATTNHTTISVDPSKPYEVRGDPILLKHKDGSLYAFRLMRTWEDPTPDPKPTWWDEITPGACNGHSGCRGGAGVWRSTDCGRNWTLLSVIDPLKFEDGDYAWPRVNDMNVPYEKGSFDRIEAYTDPWTGHLYFSTFVAGGPKIDFQPGPNYGTKIENSKSTHFLLRSTDGGNTWELLQKLTATTPLVMTSTPNGRLYVFTVRGSKPLLYYSLLDKSGFQMSAAKVVWAQVPGEDGKPKALTAGVDRRDLFYWEDVPGADSDKLRDFLYQHYHLPFVKTAAITKSSDGSEIRLSEGIFEIRLVLNNVIPADAHRVKVFLQTNEADNLFIAKDNGKHQVRWSIYRQLVYKDTNSISRITTSGSASKIRLSYQFVDDNHKTAVAVVRADIPNDSAEPKVALLGTYHALDPSASILSASFIDPDPPSILKTGPSVRANAAVFYWVEGSTDGGVHAYARYSVFTGESRGTAPAILGGPWNPTASTAHYMYGGAYSMPDGSLSFLAQWVQENGIHANIVTVPPYSLGVKSAGGVGPFHNFDLPGSDIDHLTFDAPPAGMYDLRANLCSQACDQRKDCVAWTYVRPSTVQGPKGNCWLKNKIPELSSNSCCVSGIVGEGDTDRPGGDYLHFSDVFGKEVTPQYCRLTCFQQARCKAWTYVKPNTIMGSKGVCYLKETVPKPVKNKCCLSGYFTTQVVR
jgi:hypothetical protein